MGDSYTIGERVAVAARFPEQLADSLRRKGLKVDDPLSIARTGWTTDELAGGIQNANIADRTFDLVTLLIGVNNQYRGYSLEEYRREFEQLLQRAIAFAGDRPRRVFVLSIPDYAFTPFGQSSDPTRISREIDEFNMTNRVISDQYQVNYINITPISREGLNDPELVAGDGLHPSGKMYARWVDLLVEPVVAVVKQ